MFLKTTTFILLIFILSHSIFSQKITIKGKVTDAENGDAIPYAVVFFKGLSSGTNTDFDGNYTLISLTPQDSVTTSNVGYKSRTKAITDSSFQIINFQLANSSVTLEEVEIKPGENPAWDILRNVMKNKSKNNKSNLESYEYESYSKVELDVDNISKKLRKNILMKKVIRAMDSIKRISNDEGKKVLPVFMSETMSNVYFRNSPYRLKEKINATKIVGVGVTDGTLVSQVMGSTFQDYNFYENWVSIANKEFASPIADGWKSLYNYYLIDSMMVGDHFCYKINIEPKTDGNPVFRGTIWIDKESYALKQCDLQTDKKTNLNFIEKLRIQQEFVQCEGATAWLTKKSRILIDMAELIDSTAGLLAKMYTSHKNIKVNIPKDLSFYEKTIDVSKDFNKNEDKTYWNEHRHDTLSESDLHIYKMIDTLNNLPIVRSYIEIINIVVSGYKKIGPIDFGPYLRTYSWNNIEGNRFRLGMRTNSDFSKWYQIRGYGAYGFLDKKWKYGFGGTAILSKTKWTTLTANYTNDLDQIAIIANGKSQSTTLFYTTARIGTISNRQPFYYKQSDISFESEITKGVTPKLQIINTVFDPAYSFAYYSNPIDPNSAIKEEINNTEVNFQLRLALRESFIEKDFERISLGTKRIPIITIGVNQGFKNFLGSNFQYQKYNINLNQVFNIGRFGYSKYNINASYTNNTLPYPLLYIHLGGGSSIFHNEIAFSQMNLFEFVSDKYASVNYQHHFNGYFFNKIPFLKKLKWREVASANVLMGSLQDKNRNIIANINQDGNNVVKPNGLNPNIPYIDFGIGIENILKFIRVEYYHRATYLDRPGIRPWGIKIGATFSL